MKKPTGLKPVLACIQNQGSLGKSKWHEVVFYDEDYEKRWQSYSGSRTFDDGEQVVSWRYVDEIELPNK